MKGSAHKTLLLAALLTLVFQATGQKSKEELERKREKLNERIQYTNELIDKKREDRQLTQSELMVLNKKIDYREELISTINKRVHELGEEIEENQSLIASLEEDLEDLKEDYAEMIRHAYRNRNSYDRLLFIFASSNMYQAYRRLKYYQQYADHRKQQARSIERTQKILDNKIEDLKARKKEEERLLEEKKAERHRLARDKEDQEETLGDLKSEEERLLEELNEQKEQRKKLTAAIERVIREEVEKNREENRGDFQLTPEAEQLASDFRENRGGLPWPVDRGIITSGFGEQDHPTLGSGIKIRNNGVDIETSEDAEVRSVFQGEVSSVIMISGAGKAVMVKHGSYRTVYSNLEEVYVEKGDKVEVQEKLGRAMTERSEGKTEAHFEIWEISGDGNDKLDPELWLLER